MFYISIYILILVCIKNLIQTYLFKLNTYMFITCILCMSYKIEIFL